MTPAAGVPTKTRKIEHPVVKAFHCFPAAQRIDFKLILLVYKSLNSLVPKH